MTRSFTTPRRMRGRLLLSASLLTTGLVSYGRPVMAQNFCQTDAGQLNTYLCSGSLPDRQTIFGGQTPITVIADETADFGYPFGSSLNVYGTNVTIDVREGAKFVGSLNVATPRYGSVTGTSGVDIIFNGEIDQTTSVYSDAGIRVVGKYGDTQVTTGSGDITLNANKYNIGIDVRANYQNAGDVTVNTGSGNITGGMFGIAARGNNDVTVATQSGTVSGRDVGIIASNKYNGSVKITTGTGDVLGGAYGILGTSRDGDIEITTGTGTIGTRTDDPNVEGTRTGIGAFAGYSNSVNETANTTINIGAGTVNGATAVHAFGVNSSITVDGDVFVNASSDAYGSGISTSAQGNIRSIPAEERTAANLGINTVTINAGASVDATNGKYGIVAKYGNSEIIVAGQVIGGSESAIRTNKYYSSQSANSYFPTGTTRVELQSGFDITGDVIVGGSRTDDMLALGGAGDLSFDLSKIEITQIDTGSQVPLEVLTETDEKQYYNFDLFEKVGAGTATLTGTNADITNFAVRGGTLQLDNVAAGAMAVDLIGGQLSGMGGIGNLIARSGTTVAPGSGTAAATIAVAGNLELQSGSTLAVNLDATGASDMLDVAGSAAIDTGVGLAITGEPGDYSSEDLEWTVVSATDGVTGTFDTVTDTLIDVDFADTYDGDTVKLTATVAATPPVTPPTPTPPSTPATPTTPAPNGGVSDKSNGPAGAVGAGFAGATFSGSMVEVPQQKNGASGSGSSDGNATLSSKGDPSYMTALGTIDTSVFFGIFNEETDVDSNGTSSGYDLGSSGLMGGVSLADTLGEGMEYQLNLGLGYSSTYTQTVQGSADATDYHLGIGGVLTNGPLTLTGAFGYTKSDIDLSRQVGANTATAQTDARTVSGVIEAAYDVASMTGLPDDATLSPLVRLRGYSTTADAYSESGAGALNLNVDEISSDALYGGIGLRYSGTHTVNGTTLRPSLSMIYDSKMSGDDTSSVATITGVAGAFDTTVNTGPDHLFSVDAGVAFDINSNVQGFVNYGTTFGEDLDSQRGMVGLTIKF